MSGDDDSRFVIDAFVLRIGLLALIAFLLFSVLVIEFVLHIDVVAEISDLIDRQLSGLRFQFLLPGLAFDYIQCRFSL